MVLEKLNSMSSWRLCRRLKEETLEGARILPCLISFNVQIKFTIGMSTGQLGEEFDKDMSFKLNVSQFRRRKLLEAMMADSK